MKTNMNTYKIYEYDNNGTDSNQYEIETVRAKSYDNVIKRVKTQYFQTEKLRREHLELQEEDLFPYYVVYVTTYYDTEGNEIEQPEEFDEMKHTALEEGFMIEEIEKEEVEA